MVSSRLTSAANASARSSSVDEIRVSEPERIKFYSDNESIDRYDISNSDSSFHTSDATLICRSRVLLSRHEDGWWRPPARVGPAWAA
ncbi:hypothetical protein EVAR_54778_1 [Eumeta japonica]|uniref:Uncharacterized protein n=1 Tax=Eumeta variegata TaxID=151549 RepID=A0A4C1YE69_EUMVA|nr:hypothetical protein EVAR_54778_1 [Eumeta japonica]